MAAVLACGNEALLSHLSAAALWGIVGSATPATRENPGEAGSPVHISVAAEVHRRRRGIVLHRRALDAEDATRRDGIPVTRPGRTLMDLGAQLRPDNLESAVNQADKLGLMDPETLRRYLDQRPGRKGVTALRSVLDRRTFRLTGSALERRFLRLVGRAGLPPPLTQQSVNGFRVDFFWPELGLVVETDGLRYHRTPTQQSRDKVRDQTHATAGHVALRFTHAQVVFEERRVVSVLQDVAERQRLSLLGRTR
jgi:very-short-patch-repair endonuclease